MRSRLISAVVVFACGTTAFAAPIYEYQFNAVVPATTGDVASTGTNGSALTMRNISGAAANRLGAAGSGVSGAPGDRAFANNESTVMGSAGGNNLGRADQSDNAAVDGLRSFTLQGWYNADGAPANAARLISNIGDSNAKGFEFGIGGANRLRLSINTSLAGTSSNYIESAVQPDYGLAGQWIYFAVTYNGAATTNNVSFYSGSKFFPVSLVSTGTLNLGTVPDDTAGGFTIGNYTNAIAGNGRTFDALLDNFRVFGSTSDATGVLTLSELEALRVTDVPEPAAAGLLAATSIGLLARRRRA